MFCDQLKRLRTKRGLSQEELANQLYITRQTVSKWERNLSLPDVDQLTKLSQILNTSLQELLEQDDVHLNSSTLKKSTKHRNVLRVIGIVCALFLIYYMVMVFISYINFQMYDSTTTTHVEIVEQ